MPVALEVERMKGAAMGLCFFFFTSSVGTEIKKEKAEKSSKKQWSYDLLDSYHKCPNTWPDINRLQHRAPKPRGQQKGSPG